MGKGMWEWGNTYKWCLKRGHSENWRERVCGNVGRRRHAKGGLIDLRLSWTAVDEELGGSGWKWSRLDVGRRSDLV